MKRRLEFSVVFDYRRPVEVRAMVAELKARMDPTAWAMMETVSLEVCRRASVDLETVHQVLKVAAETLNE